MFARFERGRGRNLSAGIQKCISKVPQRIFFLNPELLVSGTVLSGVVLRNDRREFENVEGVHVFVLQAEGGLNHEMELVEGIGSWDGENA